MGRLECPNIAIFQHAWVDPQAACSKALAWLHSYGSFSNKVRTRIIPVPFLVQHSTVGYFDGAAHGGFCGAGMMIRIQPDITYILGLGIGRGTNTRAELLALWGLLRFAKDIDLHELLVLGDSQVLGDRAS